MLQVEELHTKTTLFLHIKHFLLVIHRDHNYKNVNICDQ